MINCPNCGSELPDDAVFCSKCGESIVSDKKYICPYCDSELKSGALEECPECNKAFDDEHKIIKYTDDGNVYVCGRCGCKLSGSASKVCRDCGTRFNENNKPLLFDDEHPLYRVCTYCGGARSLADNPLKCSACGHDLDLKPRREPNLTEDEKKAINIREEEEKRTAEEKAKTDAKEALRIEEEAKAAEEERQLQLQKNAEKRKKIIKTVCCTTAAVTAVFVAVVVIWCQFDGRNITAAREALSLGDHEAAIKYYSYVMPLGPNASESRKIINNIKKASELYDLSREEYKSANYTDAMEYAAEANELCPDLVVADDPYNMAFNAIGESVSKLYSDGKYKEAYEYLNEIDPKYHNDTAKKVLSDIEKYVENKYSQAMSAFKAKEIDDAEKTVNEVLDISPKHEQANKLKENIATYNEYTEYLNTAAGAYNDYDYDKAEEYVNKVPDNEIGKMVKDKFPTFLSNYKNDMMYKDKPLSILNKSCKGIYSVFHDDDRAEFSFTIQNRMHRDASADVNFKYNNDTHTEHYYIEAGKTEKFSYTMYNVKVNEYSGNRYSVSLGEQELE